MCGCVWGRNSTHFTQSFYKRIRTLPRNSLTPWKIFWMVVVSITIKTLNHTNVDFNLQNLFCMEYFIKHLLNGFNYLYKAIEKEIENYWMHILKNIHLSPFSPHFHFLLVLFWKKKITGFVLVCSQKRTVGTLVYNYSQS